MEREKHKPKDTTGSELKGKFLLVTPTAIFKGLVTLHMTL